MNGTFWPTTISASWLSVVTRLGAERMLTSELPSDAVLIEDTIRKWNLAGL